ELHSDHRQDRDRQQPGACPRPLQPLGGRRGVRRMSATTRRSSATSRELQDWRVWAIGGGATVALGYQALQHLGWRAALAASPLAAAGAVGAWAWMRQRPTGFAAEATRALLAQMPDGGRPPRLDACRQEGAV